MRDDKNYTDVLLEDINSKLDMLIELVMPLTLLSTAIAELREDMTEVKSDIKVIKKVVSDHSGMLHDHEHRITRLKSA